MAIQPAADGRAPEASFVHHDDVEPQRVRAQRHADGRERSVWDRWFVISREPPFVTLHTTWDPDVLVHRHGHHGHHLMYVLRGGMWCRDRWCGPGTYIDLPEGAAAGPYVAGPEGAEIFEVTMGDGRSWTDSEQEFADLMAARGVTALPNPPIDLPDWLEDTRNDQTQSRADG